MVPGAGLEPARSNEREILSLLRLPISPSGLRRPTQANERKYTNIFGVMQASSAKKLNFGCSQAKKGATDVAQSSV